MKYVDGKTKGVLEGARNWSCEEGITKALDILKSKFGSPYLIAERIVEKLFNGFPAAEASGLNALANSLNSARITFEELS